MKTRDTASVILPFRLFPLAPGPDCIGGHEQNVDHDPDREKVDRRVAGGGVALHRDELGLRYRFIVQGV